MPLREKLKNLNPLFCRWNIPTVVVQIWGRELWCMYGYCQCVLLAQRLSVVAGHELDSGDSGDVQMVRKEEPLSLHLLTPDRRQHCNNLKSAAGHWFAILHFLGVFVLLNLCRFFTKSKHICTNRNRHTSKAYLSITTILTWPTSTTIMILR